MKSKEQLLSLLNTKYNFVDLNISYSNKQMFNFFLNSVNIEGAEQGLNNYGYEIAGVCYDIPENINEFSNGCLLIQKSLDPYNDQLYWSHCFIEVIHLWQGIED